MSLVKLPTLRTPGQFNEKMRALGIDLQADEAPQTGPEAPLNRPLDFDAPLKGRRIGNRWCTQPMEGWDGTTTGGVTAPMLRRWERFGLSGAKLIWGGEAMAVRPDGQANPNQLILNEENAPGIAGLRQALVAAHEGAFGRSDDLLVGFQLTHSGASAPTRRPASSPGWPSAILCWTALPGHLGRAGVDGRPAAEAGGRLRPRAGVAARCGADFVDVKHCHGYLLHEFLGAHTRPGPYEGSSPAAPASCGRSWGASGAGVPVEIGVRLSAFDFVPFRPDPPSLDGPAASESWARASRRTTARACPTATPSAATPAPGAGTWRSPCAWWTCWPSWTCAC